MITRHRLSAWPFLILAFTLAGCSATAPNRPIVIHSATLIDGTGRAALNDSVVVMQGGRFQAVGKRGEVTIPQGAEVIDAKGKTLLPGLIDGHCHYRDWMGELYLAYGVVTCPNISNNPVEWIIAQREGVKNGSIRGPRVWASANIIDGPPPGGTGTLRRQRTRIIVDNEDDWLGIFHGITSLSNGTVKDNVAPPSGLFAARISPLWDLTISLLMARPMPIPPDLVV